MSYSDGLLGSIASAYRDAINKGKIETARYLLDTLREMGVVRIDGGPGSGNFGHAGRPGEVGGSAPSDAPRPIKGVPIKDSALDEEGRKKASEKLKEIRRRMFEEKDFRETIGPKAKDPKLNTKSKEYDPKIFTESEQRTKALVEETAQMLLDMPKGTLIASGVMLYEKVDDDKWSVQSPKKAGGESDSKTIASSVSGYIEQTDYPPIEFIESTAQAKQIADVSIPSKDKCKEWADCFSGMERKDLIKKAKKDPGFKELVDNVVLYTEGGYTEQRQLAEVIARNGTSDVSCLTVGEYSNGQFLKIRDLWKGQDLKSSESSIANGMAALVGVINESEPTGSELYRVTQDRTIAKKNGADPYVPPSVGDKIKIDAPTSFTASKAVEAELATEKSCDIIHYVLQPGANATNVAPLSRYKQEEFLSCGEYEVVSVETKTRSKPVFGEPTEAQKKRGVKEDEFGWRTVDLYETYVCIKQTGKIELGGRKDDTEEWLTCDGHFDNRMVLSEKGEEDGDDEDFLEENIDSDENVRQKIIECLFSCLESGGDLAFVASVLLQYIARAVVSEDRTDGGPGSGNFNHRGRPGQVGGSASAMTSDEEDAIAFWKGGGNGWGYANIRAIANNREAPLVKKYKDLGLPDRAQEIKAELEKITASFESVLSKAPTADNKDLIRVTGSYAIPGVGKPEIGQTFSLDKYTSFSAAEGNDRAEIVEKFGASDQVVLSIKGTKDFRDISGISNNVGGVANEKEVLTDRTMKYRITAIEQKNFGGEYIDRLNTFFGGVNVQLVTIEPDQDGRDDGGPGSGNFGHGGRPGQVGGSSPGNGSRSVVHGKDISKTYKGPGDFKSVVKAQGFDGFPKVVRKSDFDAAVKASRFIAQRTYSASSKEVLDAYRDQLYNGEWNAECLEGGSLYGKGMYCAADYNGELTDGIKQEMQSYGYRYANSTDAIANVETLTLDPSAKIVTFREANDMYRGVTSDDHRVAIRDRLLDERTKDLDARETAFVQFNAGKSIPWKTVNEAAESLTEARRTELATFAQTISRDANEEYARLSEERHEAAKEYKQKYSDVGTFAAALGYDAINAEGRGQSGSYTVVLNRTKVIFLDERDHKDSADSDPITFQLGADGVIYAIRNRRVIGWVRTSDVPREK